MDMTKYEMIEGGFAAAVAHMAKGKVAYTEWGARYVIDVNGKIFNIVDSIGLVQTQKPYNELALLKWFAKKPFDVRQAMRDKPDEWVAAFKGSHGGWFALGFDSNDFHPVFVAIREMDEVGTDSGRVLVAIREQIDNAISIQDVPKEATR